MRELDFIEACYAPLPHHGWVQQLCEVFTSLLDAELPAAGYYYSIDADARVVTDGVVSVRERSSISPSAMVDHLNQHPLRHDVIPHTFGAAPRQAIALSQLPSHMQHEVRKELGGADSLGLLAALQGDSGFLLGTYSADGLAPTPRQATTWQALATHLAVGQALRVGDYDEVARYRPSGRLEHADAVSVDRSVRDRLADLVRHMDGARIRRRKLGEDEVLAAWQGLHDGQYSLVERREENAKRTIAVLRVVRDPRALTSRERQVAQRAARGQANKRIALELGLSVSAVGTYLASAMRKLSCADRTQLARWWSS